MKKLLFISLFMLLGTGAFAATNTNEYCYIVYDVTLSNPDKIQMRDKIMAITGSTQMLYEAHMMSVTNITTPGVTYKFLCIYYGGNKYNINLSDINNWINANISTPSKVKVFVGPDVDTWKRWKFRDINL